MDFNLPEELQMLKDTVRKFVDKELIPIEMHTLENMELKPDIRERLEKTTQEMGLWMFDVPEEYGGGGLGSLAQVLVWEELARTVALPSRGQGIFGPELQAGESDLYRLADRVARAPGRPALWLDCGTEDELLPDSRAFHAHLDGLGYTHHYEERPGVHDWAYWDGQIQRVLDWLPLK